MCKICMADHDEMLTKMFSVIMPSIMLVNTGATIAVG